MLKNNFEVKNLIEYEKINFVVKKIHFKIRKEKSILKIKELSKLLKNRFQYEKINIVAKISTLM